MASDDFDTADRAIVRMLKKLKSDNLCPCCVASALLVNGAHLSKAVSGAAHAIDECKRLASILADTELAEKGGTISTEMH